MIYDDVSVRGRCFAVLFSNDFTHDCVDHPTVTPPDWMTPELLYKINYGPLTKKESNQVAWFVNEQLSTIKGRQYTRTVSSSSAHLWRSILPFLRPPISPSIDTRKNRWPTPRNEDPQSVVLGILDPKLAIELLSKLFPFMSLGLPPDAGYDNEHERRRYFELVYSRFRHTPERLEVETQLSACLLMFEHNLLNLCRRRYGSGDTMVFPLGALTLDVLKLIQTIQSSIDDVCNFGHLATISEKYLFSSLSYLSTAERGRSYSAGTTQRFLKRVLFRSDDHYLPGWERDDEIADFFSGVLKGSNSNERSRNFDIESSRLDISNLDASYICSGPFRLMLTTRLERHLHLDKSGLLYVFWDFTREVGSSLDIYKNHFFWDISGDLKK